MSTQEQEFVQISLDKRVMVIQLNRPHVHNALCKEMMRHLNYALDQAENDPEIGVIVLTGNKKAFASGVDISEMVALSFQEITRQDFLQSWERLGECKKPVIAAVSGYALGGGFELAMMCDLIYASPSAQFGQPEITLGTLPGMGGTQRLAQWIGKAQAMDLCLTGRLIGAEEALKMGIVSRLFSQETLLEETMRVADRLSRLSSPVVCMIKQSILQATDGQLRGGRDFERRLFQSTFALEDRKEGMSAFLEKRPPVFKHT